MDKTLRIGTIGTSSIMNIIQEGIAQTDGFETVMVYSRNINHAKEYAASVNVPEYCDDYLSMLNREDIDIIYVASPNKLHFQQALMALEHGKHVIVEKPTTVTEQETRTLYETAKRHGVFFFEAITTLYMPNYMRFKQLLPTIGTLTHVEINFGQYSSKYDSYLRGENPNIFNPELQGGALNDMGIYCIHVAVDLFGEPLAVQYSAELGENGVDLAGKLLLTYPDFVCEINTSKKDVTRSGCFFTGTKGSLIEDGALIDFPNCSITLDQTEEFNFQFPGNRMIHEFANFRDAILYNDHRFFEKMAHQSILASSILEKAHNS